HLLSPFVQPAPPVRHWWSSALSLEILVEIVEQGSAAFETRGVVLVRHGDPGHQAIDPGGLGAFELAVLEIDVVNDLRDRAEGRFLQVETFHQHLEGAVVAFMGVFRLEHVEAQLAALWPVAFSRYELEGCTRINETADEPRAGHSINVDACARHPGAASDSGTIF